jgi:hypothetical protein
LTNSNQSSPSLRNQNLMNYIDTHKHLLQHYIGKEYGGLALVFTEQFMNDNLPTNSTSAGLNICLLDNTDNKIYKSKIYVAYEDATTLDNEYNSIEVKSLMGYFYGSYHCACHRKHDAQKVGAIVENDECEGKRFLIYSITCDKLPDLNLYSEVLTEDELENLLVNNT